MDFTIYFFYLFATLMIASSLVVVTTRNMIYGAIFLILTFINCSGIFILLGAEFIGMMLIVVYVGAIAVLFLFVIMMLNVDIKVENKPNKKLPILILVSVVMFCEVMLITKLSGLKQYNISTSFPMQVGVSNTESIGKILYTNFALPFEIVGSILFVAMIGAIVLTLKQQDKLSLRKQNVFNQIQRNKANSLEILKVNQGEGINL